MAAENLSPPQPTVECDIYGKNKTYGKTPIITCTIRATIVKHDVFYYTQGNSSTIFVSTPSMNYE